MMGPERRFAFGDLLANRRCAWAPVPFSSSPGHPRQQLDWNGDDQRLRLRPGGSWRCGARLRRWARALYSSERPGLSAAVAPLRALQVAGPGFLNGQSAPFGRCEEWRSSGVDVRLGLPRGYSRAASGGSTGRSARKKPHVCVLIWLGGVAGHLRSTFYLVVGLPFWRDTRRAESKRKRARFFCRLPAGCGAAGSQTACPPCPARPAMGHLHYVLPPLARQRFPVRL